MRKHCPQFMSRFICCVVLSLAWIHCARAMDLYVSPDGNDRWSGRLEQPNIARTDGPLATLGGARDRLRRLRLIARIPGPIRVVIADGKYRLNAPFVLEPQDSGMEGLAISYEAAPGARPVLRQAGLHGRAGDRRFQTRPKRCLADPRRRSGKRTMVFRAIVRERSPGRAGEDAE